MKKATLWSSLKTQGGPCSLLGWGQRVQCSSTPKGYFLPHMGTATVQSQLGYGTSCQALSQKCLHSNYSHLSSSGRKVAIPVLQVWKQMLGDPKQHRHDCPPSQWGDRVSNSGLYQFKTYPKPAATFMVSPTCVCRGAGMRRETQRSGRSPLKHSFTLSKR